MTDDEEKPPPHLRLAAENDETAIRANLAMEAVEAAVRKLAANLMRVARGAGKSHEIGRDCLAVVEAYHAYHDVAGHWPPNWDLDNALRINDPLSEHYDDGWGVRNARERIMRAGLRTAAARLLEQHLQITAGENDLTDGIRLLEEARARLRAKVMAENPTPRRKKRVSMKRIRRKK